MTLRIHSSEMGIIKFSTLRLRNDVSQADFDSRELIKRFDKSFSDCNTKMTEVEKSCERVRNDFQPLMECFSPRINKLEADFATMMSTHASPPRMGHGPNVASHNIGPPAPVTPPTK